MKDTRVTIILAKLFHRHKYITNPGVIPEDRVIATAGKLVVDLKGRMENHLSKTALEKMDQLGTILKQGWSQKDNQKQTPPITPPRQTIKLQVALTQKVVSGVPIPHILYTPHLIFQYPKGVSLPTPAISPTATPPRVVPPSRVEQPVTPRQSPRLVAKSIKK